MLWNLQQNIQNLHYRGESIMKNISKDMIDDLEILKDEINDEIHRILEEFNSSFEYKYFEEINKLEFKEINSFEPTKEGFEKYKKNINLDSLKAPILTGFIKHDNGFVLEIVKNPEEKYMAIDKITLNYINQIFDILGLDKSKKIEFEHFIHSFILISDKYSNEYDNNLYDLDKLVTNKHKLKFLKEIFG